MRSEFSLLPKIRAASVTLGLGLMLTGCGSSANLTDGGMTTARFALKLASPTVTGLTIGEGLDVSAATITVKRIELWLPEDRDCEDSDNEGLDDRGGCHREAETEDDLEEDKIKIEGPFVFNLLTGESTPPLTDFSIPSGVYKRIRLKADPDAAATVSISALVGEAPLEIAFQSDEEIDVETAEGLSVQEGSINAIVAEVNLSGAFAQFDLAACVSGGNFSESSPGAYVANSSNPPTGACSELLEILEESIFRESRVSCDHEDESEDDDEAEDEDDDDSSESED